MSQKYFYPILVLFSIFVLSCSSSEYLKFNPNNEYTVNFYFSNQNPFRKEPIHIIVKLIYPSEDQETFINVFDQNCSFGEGLSKGHNLQAKELNLKEGHYKLLAETNSNDCKLDVDFEITKEQWIYLGYDENDQLELKFSSSPFIFG